MKKNLNKISSESLVAMLKETNPVNVCGAICEIVKRDHHIDEEQVELKKLIKNKNSFWNNYLISDFAEAALDILGWMKYKGSRREVIQLIDSKLVFD